MTRRISVAFVNNFPGPSLGGGEVQLLTLLRGLVAARVSPTVVCAARSALERQVRALGDVPVIPVDLSPGSLPALIPDLATRLRGLHVVQGTGFLTNLIARKVGARAGIRVVNTVHVVPGASRADGEQRVFSAVRTLLDRSSRAHVDRYVAVSKAVREGLVADGVDPRMIVVVSNGVDVTRLQNLSSEQLGISLPEAGSRIGYVGRLERIKGCEYFVRSAALLADRHPDSGFIVAGAGSLELELRTLAGRLGVVDRIRFLGHVESVAPLLAALDVVAIPSLSEASGLTAMEALAVGVPVVAARVGGLPEVVVDGETGLLVAPADAPALARAISRLLDDPQLARRLAAAGTQRVEELFPEERMIRGYLDLYEELVS